MIKVTGLVVLAALTASAQAHLTYLDLRAQGTACCMVTDGQGNVYTAGNLVAGNTSKIVVSKIDPAGNLVYRLVFGGSGLDTPDTLSVDSNGDLFLGGVTSSADFPLVSPLNSNAPRALQRGFLSKIDPTGTRLLFSTFIGAMQSDADTSVGALTLDQAGNVYLTGVTDPGGTVAPPPDFPVTAGAFAKTGNVFVMKVTNAGNQIVFSTFLGWAAGSQAIAVDGQSQITVAGSYAPTPFAVSSFFPVTPGAFQTVCSNCLNAIGAPGPYSGQEHLGSFVSRLSAGGSSLVWSTFLAGPGCMIYGPTQDTIRALSLTSDGGVIVAGVTDCPGFPVTPGAFQTTLKATKRGTVDPTNVFVTRFNSTGTSLKYSTLLGGSIEDDVSGLQVDAQDHPWITGRALSPDFPSLPGTPIIGDEFVVKLAADGSGLLQTQRFPDGGAGTALSISSGAEVLLGQNGSVIQIPASGLTGTAMFGAVNSAFYSVAGRVAPGEVISLYGSGLGPSTGVVAQFDASGNLPTSLAGVQLTFDGSPAPLLYVGAAQINAVVPFGVGGKAQTSVQVISGSASSSALQLAVVAADPAIVTVFAGVAGFPTVPPPAGQIYTAALNQDNSFNSPTNPAKAGSIVSFWANGAGAFSPALVDGTMVEPPLPQPVQPVSVLFDGQPAQTTYAGAAPSFVAGPIQINLQLPQTLPATFHPYHQVQLKVSNFSSTVVPIYVQP
jgi:uncharacterized protein (TIGR03437 family)